MLGHYLRTLYRSLTRHRLYAALNVLGLAVGIAVFLVLSLYVKFETGFERWIPNASSIYVVRSTWKLPGHSADSYNNTMGGLLEELHEDFPHLLGTRVWSNGGTVRQAGRTTAENVFVVDPAFFKVFDLPLATGDKANLLSAPDQVLLTETRAKTYFGSTNPLGQRLTLSLQGKLRDYRVAGVLKDLPHDTELNFDIVIPITPELIDREHNTPWLHWGSSQLLTYLRFDTPAQAQALNAQLDAFTDRRGARDMNMPDTHTVLSLRAAPLVSIHLADAKDQAVVAMLGAVGALTLLLAAVNYVNLATARAGLRAREVALRKVLGATTPALVGQFLAEALATAALAGLIGLAMAELSMPLVNAAGGLSLKLDYLGSTSVIPFILCVVVLIGLGAGAYPAFALSRFQAAGVLASARTPGGGRAGSRLREVLVAAQFAIAIAFTIATAVILSQGRYLRNADLGFRRDGLIVVRSFDSADVTASQRTSLLEAWRTTPGVTGVTFSDIAPGVDDSTSANNAKRPGVIGDGPSVNFVVGGPDFFATYGMRLVAGRVLDRSHGFDDRPILAPGASPEAIKHAAATTVRTVVLNVNALKTLGFASPEDAIGKPLLSGVDDGGFRPLEVVGVVENTRFRSPHKAVPGTAYMMSTHDPDNAVAAVRYDAADPKAMVAKLQQVWRRVVPGAPFRARTAEQGLQSYYKPDDQRGRLFSIGAGLAVAIGCVGLYGLASFNTARRTREIGIRKTLGASTTDILRLLVGQFLRPVLLANLIAWPLAYVAMEGWLSGFDQRIALGPSYFVAATLLTLAIALLTVVSQALRVARAEPARALRYE